MKQVLFGLFLGLCALILSCGADPVDVNVVYPDQGQTTGSDNCTMGTKNCACMDSAIACEPGLDCVDNTCVIPTCTPGYKGCPCTAGTYPCGIGLECSLGKCVEEGCPSGTLECPCVTFDFDVLSLLL